MNRIILILSALFLTSNIYGQTDVTPTSVEIGVRGNCGMCKATIEKAALGVDGVQKASWNSETMILKITYASWETDELAIHNAVADSGYDTEKVLAKEQKYKTLPNCCQYDRDAKFKKKKKKTEAPSGSGGHSHSGHSH